MKTPQSEVIKQIRQEYQVERREFASLLRKAFQPARKHTLKQLPQWKWWIGSKKDSPLDNAVDLWFNPANYTMGFKADAKLRWQAPAKVLPIFRRFRHHPLFRRRVSARLAQKRGLDYAEMILNVPVRRWTKAQKTTIYNNYIRRVMGQPGYAGYKVLWHYKKKPFIIELSVAGFEAKRRKGQEKAGKILMDKLVDELVKELAKRYGKRYGKRGG